MNRELARKRPADVQQYRPPAIRLVAVERPLPRPSTLRRVMTPADWPVHVVLLVHVALAGAVVLPFIWLAEVLGR
jgi:hypothetical protein